MGANNGLRLSDFKTESIFAVTVIFAVYKTCKNLGRSEKRNARGKFSDRLRKLSANDIKL